MFMITGTVTGDNDVGDHPISICGVLVALSNHDPVCRVATDEYHGE